MKTSEITVNVSKKIGRTGSFGSDMVSASIKVTVEDDEEVSKAYLWAWKKCWEEVDKQEEEIESHKEIEKSVKETQAKSEAWLNQPAPVSPAAPVYTVPTTVPANDAKTCPIHGVALVWKQAGISKNTGKPYPGFYSCPSRNADGSFCKFHPK